MKQNNNHRCGVHNSPNCDCPGEEVSPELRELLNKMDIPKFRINDISWIRRNLPFQNSEHPDFARAWELLGQPLKSQQGEQ